MDGDSMQARAKMSKIKKKKHAKKVIKIKQNQTVTLAMNEWRQFIVTFK